VAGRPTELPRLRLVFRIGQCDNQNHGWCEGPAADRRLQSFDLLAGPSPSQQSQFQTKKEYCFLIAAARLSL
jgi:hypothetical protein